MAERPQGAQPWGPGGAQRPTSGSALGAARRAGRGAKRNALKAPGRGALFLPNGETTKCAFSRFRPNDGVMPSRLSEAKTWLASNPRKSALRVFPAGIRAAFGSICGLHPPPAPPSLRWQATAAPCGPFQAWTKPLHPGQAWAQPLRGSGLAHPLHCKTSQPLPVDNCKQLPTAIDCHQGF